MYNFENSKIKIDKLDRKILYYLDHDGRISFSALARKVNRGRDVVEYRVSRLRDNNIIKKFNLVVNPYKFGLTIYKTYIRFKNNKAKIQKLISDLKKEKNVFWIVKCDGEWDLIFSIAARSVYEFHRKQGELLQEVADIIISSQVYTVVYFKIYRNKYLLDSGTHWFDVGGEAEFNKLDSLETEIMMLLSENARYSVNEISRFLNTTPAMVQNRISKLENQKLILGYKAVIDAEALGLTHFKTQLFLNDFNKKEEAKLEAFCNKHPYIICYIMQVGACRSEIEILAPNYAVYLEIIDKLREEFPRLIQNISTILMNDEIIKWMVLTSPLNRGWV